MTIDIVSELSRRPNLQSGLTRLPAGARQLVSDQAEAFFTAPGSGHNHQAWPGGYADHVDELFAIAARLYQAMNELRSLPFSLDQVLLVLFLHDIEKIWKRLPAEVTARTAQRYLSLASDQHALQALVAADYDLPYQGETERALRHIHGEDNDYSKHERAASPLSAFCHDCDYFSARIWFSEPQLSGALSDQFI